MDNWTPTTGTHTLTATVSLVGDNNTSNNELDVTVQVIELITAFAWDAYHTGAVGISGKGPVNIVLPTGTLSQIALDDGDFISGADYVNGDLYGLRYNVDSGCPLVKIDPITGDITEIGGGGTRLTGFTYDVTEEIAYVMDIYGVLYTMDLNNGAITTIGGEYNLAIGLACSGDGTLYAISLESDNLVTIDKTTGAATVIGSLGININYAQDIAYDRDNDVLYGTLFTSSGGLYIINTTTGTATLLTEFVDELTGFAIPYEYDNEGIEEIDPNKVQIYPNPSEGIVNIVVEETAQITVYDMVGKLISTHHVDAQEILTIQQSSGIYIVKVETEKGFSSYKLVIK